MCVLDQEEKAASERHMTIVPTLALVSWTIMMTAKTAATSSQRRMKMTTRWKIFFDAVVPAAGTGF